MLMQIKKIHACDQSTWEMEVGGLPSEQSQPGLQRDYSLLFLKRQLKLDVVENAF